ncbi:hypothetical protein [Actinomyces oris]|uniref:hypothetical protein n=1 Tax=Actinomyces oris TaxID=544580 RepID=UPI000A9723BB|nr:hypothetical protein [Actinomyces oris]
MFLNTVIHLPCLIGTVTDDEGPSLVPQSHNAQASPGSAADHDCGGAHPGQERD